jgi:hypothetical protein
MSIEYERQELRALALLPIRHLPAYSADVDVTFRVGKAVAAHTELVPWDRFSQLNLKKSLSEPEASSLPIINAVVALAP